MLEVLSNAQIASQQKQLEAAEMIEKLQSEQHERDLATEESRRKAQQMQELVQLGKRYAPAVVNHLLKGNVVPGATNPSDDIMSNLLQEVSAEEAAEIYRVLGAKAAPLMDLYLQAHGEKPIGEEEDDRPAKH
jgi:DNA-binding MarR family transcriptional regulator